MDPELIALLMFVFLAIFIFLGFPLFAVLAGVSVIGGYLGWGSRVFSQMILNTWSIMGSNVLPAVPLFVFMGTFMEASGVAERAYKTIRIILGPVKGSLALATIIICTLFAAATGIVGASVTVMGLLALPSMLKYSYNKPLATGTILAGGTLGILIPPSVLLILYGPLAGLPIPSLFAGAILPGLLLSVLYIVYIIVICKLKPELAPSLPSEEMRYKIVDILKMFTINVFPFIFVIILVLGSIILGVASPTEAASIGVIGSLGLAIIYRKLTWEKLKKSVYETMIVTSFVIIITVAAKIFGGVFLALGGGNLITNFFLSLKIGSYGILSIILLLIFIMGFFLDWIPILLIFIPIVAPMVPKLGFDPLWFGIVTAVCLQTSFLTPPFAVSIFYLKGIAPSSVQLKDIYRGITPFIILQIIGLIITILFPQLVLWIPTVMGIY
ncbi:MAG: TRAP transporter large permease subunit [Atribacterota bacterium]|nr:TRAP transporter large permease subunit [Atribacterota bacterium]MDD5636771.1 TRAP transporter large permease subunit [Atribacterota bacterium]